MPYCSSCGAELTAGASFCASCGAAVTSTSSTLTTTTYPSATGAYSLVLLDLGTCPQTQADDVIQDLLGYSELDCIEILTSMPTEIAQSLTQQQALYLAQAFTEYGMDVAVYCNGTYVDLGAQATTAVYQSDGSILKNVLTTLATVTIANRLSRFLRWTQPAPPPFRPHAYTPAPPRHVRRSIVRTPEPPRQPRPVSPARPPHASGPHGQGPTRGMSVSSARRSGKGGHGGAGRGRGGRGGHRI